VFRRSHLPAVFAKSPSNHFEPGWRSKAAEGRFLRRLFTGARNYSAARDEKAVQSCATDHVSETIPEIASSHISAVWDKHPNRASIRASLVEEAAQVASTAFLAMRRLIFST